MIQEPDDLKNSGAIFVTRQDHGLQTLVWEDSETRRLVILKPIDIYGIMG